LPEKVGEDDDPYELRSGVLQRLGSIKWYLWHGNTFQALNKLQDLEMDLEAAAFESKEENTGKLLKSIAEIYAASTAFQSAGAAWLLIRRRVTAN
jgi:hypothetical protein